MIQMFVQKDKKKLLIVFVTILHIEGLITHHQTEKGKINTHSTKRKDK